MTNAADQPGRNLYERRRTSFGAGAADYDRVRPDWPAATLTWLLGSSPAGSIDVLDLGAGTGKGTRALAALGHRVTAVEPSSGMLDTLRQSLGRSAPEHRGRIEVQPGSAQAIPLADACVDAVTALQAWHWFDHDAAAAECARVLRRGGWLGTAWHAWDRQTPWLRDLADVVRMPEMVGVSREWIDPAMPAAFAPVERRSFDHDHRLAVQDLVTLAASWSAVAVDPDREAILEQVQQIGERVADAAGIVTFPHVTTCYRFRRL